jgi:glycosyltransferase involved in cell wall biosynthesis
MHILQCYKTALPLSMGGVEQVMHHISAGLVEHSHQSTILAFSPEPKVQEISYHGYRVIGVPATQEIASMPLSTKGFSYFKNLCKEADIIHYHYPFPWMDLMHLVHPHDKPCVMTYHSDIVKQKNLLKLYKPLQQYFLKQMDAIVATSPKYIESSETLKKYADKVHCIPLGLDDKNYAKVSQEKLNEWKTKLPERFLLFVGVFRYYKGLKYLLEALEGLDYPVALIGDGPEKAALLALKEKFKLNNLFFLGSLDDENKNAVLTLSSGLILPSHLRSEAFGLSLLEGAMFGKPLISCEILTGTSYINQDGVTGWVAQPEDKISLQNVLTQWYQNPEKSLEFGKNARARYQELFQASKMVQNYLDLYNKMI